MVEFHARDYIMMAAHNASSGPAIQGAGRPNGPGARSTRAALGAWRPNGPGAGIARAGPRRPGLRVPGRYGRAKRAKNVISYLHFRCGFLKIISLFFECKKRKVTKHKV